MPESKEQTADLNAKELKSALWDTMRRLRSGEIPPGVGDAIAAQAREIIRTSNTQLKILSQARAPVTDELVEFAQSRKL